MNNLERKVIKFEADMKRLTLGAKVLIWGFTISLVIAVLVSATILIPKLSKPSVKLHYDCTNYGMTMKYKLYEDGMMDLTTDKDSYHIPYEIVSEEGDGIVFEFGTGLDKLRIWLVQGSMITSVNGRTNVYPCKVLE